MEKEIKDIDLTSLVGELGALRWSLVMGFWVQVFLVMILAFILISGCAAKKVDPLCEEYCDLESRTSRDIEAARGLDCVCK